MRLAIRALATLLVLAAAEAGQRQQVALDPASVVTYQARDQQGEIIGRAPVAELDLELDLTDLTRSSVRVAIEPDRFDSGSWIRDTNARRALFETADYPVITFTSTRIEPLENTGAQPTSATLRVTGDVTVREVTREISAPVEVRLRDDHFEATGSFAVSLSDFELPRPRFLWLVVEDEVRVSFDIRGQVTP